MNGTLAVMGKQGDTRLAWDSDKSAEVEAARSMFNDLHGKGYAAFSIRGQDKRGEQMREFDPLCERILMVPPIAGG